MDEKKSSEPKKNALPWSESDYATNVKCPHCGSTEMLLVQRRAAYLTACVRCRHLVHLDTAMEEYDLSVIWGDNKS